MSDHNLKYRQEKIQAKRKQTPWRDFLMDIGSWKVMNFYAYDGLISKFPQTNRVGGVRKILDYEDYRDNRDFISLDLQHKGNFFDLFGVLLTSIDVPSVIHFQQLDNCDYADVVSYSKNCYLSFWPINNCENIVYSDQVKDRSTNIFGSMMVWDHSDSVYQSKGILTSSRIFYSQYLYNCSDIWFSVDLVGCRECTGCSGLENSTYCINNISYTKDEYFRMKDEILRKKTSFDSLFAGLTGNGLAIGSVDSTGSHILYSHNIANAYLTYQVTNGRNLFAVGGATEMTNIYDNINTGPGVADHIYGVVGAGIDISHVYNSCHIASGSHNIYYSYFLTSCSYCLGCIGLKNKSYCIFNKQYTKEGRHKKVDEIFSQMEQDDTLGQFFPGSLNPFYFNDTAAYLIDDSFTKEEVTAKGYLRRDEPIAVDVPEWMDVVEVRDLDQYEGRKDSASGAEGQEWWIDPAILKKVIRDEQGNVYRVIKMEYDFLMKYGLPLPRKHWLERLKEHFTI